MPYCPECSKEFKKSVKVCPDCGAALTDRLPDHPEQKETDEPLVHIATAPNEPIGKMWADILEEHGVPSLIKGGNLGATMYIPSFQLPSEIYVLASKADEAKEILGPFMEEG